MSPHILIDHELDAMADPDTPINWQVMIQRQLNEMMADERITIEEFNHYCDRLNKIAAKRQEGP